MTAENIKIKFKENEVVSNNFTEENKNLKILKAKNFIEILFEIITETNNIYEN